MNLVEDDCAHHALLPEGQSTLFDSLPHFDEDIAEGVTAEDLPLSSPPEPVDEAHGGSGSSLPATPAERPCTFCPASLPLPPASDPSRVTLVLDLDGTLIASEELNAANSAYLWNPHDGARDPDYEAMGRRVWLRPGVREFLAAVRPHFEIVLFTAATQNWAAAAIEQLDPSAYLFDVMLHRDHTTSDMMWDYVKDLSRLGRDLARVVIVDDNPLMFMYQPDNALHIGAYEAASAGGPDNVLERVSELLVGKVAVAEDVREVLGPLARAKSCIVSTVNAKAAPQPASETATAAAPSGDGAGEPVTDAATHSGGSASGAAAEDAGDGAAVPSHADDSAAAVLCSEGLPDSESSGEEEEAEEPMQDEQDQSCSHELGSGSGAAQDAEDREEEEQQDGEQGVEEGRGCELRGAQAGMEEGAFRWGCESEVPEIFDEHGVPASLGTGTWPEHCSGVGGRDTAALDAAAAATAVAAGGCYAGAVSGSAPAAPLAPAVEQHAGHGGHEHDDFDALMEDAIAEYDSDAYEGQYDDTMPYDGECPARTAAAVAGATVSVAAACLSADDCASLQGCTDNEACLCGCVLRTCAFDFGCAGGMAGSGIFGGGSLTVEVHAGVAAAERPGLPPCIAPASLDVGAEAPVAGAEQASEPAGSGAKAGGDVTATSAGELRQPPTGMVFLTDLHPSLTAPSSAACDVGHGAGGAALEGIDGPGLRHGSKRAREDDDLSPGCDEAAPQCRFRLEGSGDVATSVAALHAASNPL